LPKPTGDNTTETRSFALLAGTPPPIGMAVAEFDSFAFPADPTDLGLAFEEVSYPGPDGDLDAWFLPGTGSRWIIAVHGLGATPREFLRMIDATRQLALPTLVIAYRNDAGAPASEGALILAGQEEWQDVAAAVEYTRSLGASDVVLYGASMGGALVLSYALEQPVAPVAGLILESPNADLRHAIDVRSGEALPIGGPIGDSFLGVGRLFATMRTGIDFDTVDYVARADALTMPILLFHGKDDRTVPFAVGEALAEARPDLVEFHGLDDAGHVRAWNEDPDAFREIVTAFLENLAD
jgi:pimeloyl-ACP methyl ester carboxylesterase